MSTSIYSGQDQRTGAADERCISTRAPSGNELIIEPACASLGACRGAAARKFAQGFTLIELMLVVAVAGVLSGVAYPSFMGQLQKIRRADAMVSLLQVQAAQERWRANNLAYGTLAEVGVAATSAAGHYTLQVAAASASGYEIVAAAAGSQAHDTACRHLRLRVEGGNVVQASGADAATNNSAQQNRQCWIV